MWKLIINILSIGANFIPVIGFVYLFIKSRDERIIGLTQMKIELDNFNKKYSTVYKNIERQVESPTEYELEEIRKIKNDIKLSEREGRENLNRFLIILLIYVVFTCMLISNPGSSSEMDDVEFQV